MKKIHLFAIFLFGTIAAQSQSYIGFLTDNYSGVHGVINNPASIADSRFKADINLVGLSALVGNDYFGFDLNEISNDDYEIDDDAKRFPKGKNTVFGNIDILGPSFMFNLNEKSAIAVFTRARAFYNINSINGNNVTTLEDGFDDNQDFIIDEGDAYASTNIWSEIGVSYARVLMDKDEHFLKGGLSLKYLMGLGNAYASTNNLSINYDADGTSAGQTTLGSVETSGDLGYGYSENFNDDVELDELDITSSGFGVDLGFVYEWRPNKSEYTYKNAEGNDSYYRDINKYKLKFGLSVTDLGYLSYDGNEDRYDINATVSQEQFEDIEDNDDLDNLYTSTSKKLEDPLLPTALHFNADWNINQKFYLNLNTDLSLVDREQINTSSIANIVSLTPRFERKWFTFQMPFSVQQDSGFQWGAGLRAGPLYIGSGSVITALFNDETKAADVYLGLKIPVYHNRPKDKDGDGVFDKIDNCPKDAGPAENAGCPWGDSDGDGVLDNVDNCPNEVGPSENNGCPWTDKDNDGILDKDDSCPDEAGIAENNGCPNKDNDGDTIINEEDNCPNEAGSIDNQGCPWGDIDGDGVLDNVDNCPTTAGPIDNKGCPQVTVEVQKALNSYAKTILFDSGKSTIKSQSNKVLNDIVAILKKYPNSNFKIEGHTDSAGSNVLNQNLSDSRANSVKVFLIENGITQSRLSAIGYGEDKPITSNTTKEGRAKNRRVEINLVN